MIKLFRKNRQNSLGEGKIGKYLKYAIGEIILVVLGILIALYLNDRNSKRAEEKAAISVYENIKQQVVNDMTTLNHCTTQNKELIEKYWYASNIIEQNDREKIDTLGKIVFELSKYSDFNRSSTIYQNLLNSGESKLLKNTAILEQIQKLEEAYILVNRTEEIHFEIISFFGPDIFKSIKFYDLSTRDSDKLFGIDFQNYFMSAISISSDKEYAYQLTIDQIELLIELLDEELNH
ncbi:DUF6090 family protein [Aureitalea marina]|uniref:Uncharacterized protein n=1 Tax=Aureitalea marina TaxID=930804 RepID=A0A2S7KSY1_9FLAO|nr:DUF6090 family protein [Aureitalea marina]PQB05735.1 hypothetical protein BST85_13165 [Aureitalea marina]